MLIPRLFRLTMLVIIATVFPFIAIADASSTQPAGFAPAIWLSSAAITEGDAVKVSTTVYDATPSAIDGTVTFLVDGASIGAAPFSLSPGASIIVSAPWKAVAGVHSFAARIDGSADHGTKAPVAVTSAITPIQVTVAAAPPPPAYVAVAGKAADAASTVLTTAAPIAVSLTQKLVQGAEGVRTAGAGYLAAQLAASDPPKTQVLGTTTYRAATSSPKSSAAASTGSTIVRTTERWLLSLFLSPALFYLAALLLALFLFWVIRRRFGNERA